jgi:CBS domain-containing protein
MRVGDVCTRAVVYCTKDTSALDAAKMMRDAHFDNVAVVEEREGRKIPVGVITHRDIAVQLVAKQVDPRAVAAGDLMARELLAAPEEEDIHDTIERMRFGGVRRLPAIDREGALARVMLWTTCWDISPTSSSASRGSRRGGATPSGADGLDRCRAA